MLYLFDNDRILIAGLMAFLVSLLLTPAIRSLARNRFRDGHWTSRSGYALPIYRVGGVAIVSGTLLGAIIGANYLDWRMGLLGMASVALVYMGIMDDLRPLPQWAKHVPQVIAAILGAFALRPEFHLRLPVVEFDITGMAAIVLAALWIVLIVNLMTLIDGIDGLAAGVSALMAMGVLLLTDGSGGFLMVPLAAALLGFLAWNSGPASNFMGDSGSRFIGFVISVGSIHWPGRSVEIIPVGLVFAPLILDAGITLIRQLRAHLSHSRRPSGFLYQRLVGIGYSQRSVSNLYFAATAASMTAAAVYVRGTPSVQLLILIGVLAIGAAFAIVVSVLESNPTLLPLPAPSSGFTSVQRRRAAVQTLNDQVGNGVSEDKSLDDSESPLPLASETGSLSSVTSRFHRVAQALAQRTWEADDVSFDDEEPERVLIVGAGAAGQILARDLVDNLRWNLMPVAFVDDDIAKRGKSLFGLPVMGDSDTIPALVKSESIDVVIIAIPSAPPALHRKIADVSQQTGCRVLTLPAIGSILRGEEQVTTLKQVRPVDVLGRPVVAPDRESCIQFIRGRRVLITGASGSIGSELSVQIAQLQPEKLVLVDIDETGLHDLRLRIARETPEAKIDTLIANISDRSRVVRLFNDEAPEIVLHAAAYKHVPAMERQPDQAIETNVIGTRNVVEVSAEVGVDRFVMVSTDKAVRPSSVMGASKRLAELVVASVGQSTGLSVCSVRFGNVLGSRGSVIPTFEAQIQAGGPVTITDPRMRRYFMTIPEAASLIIQAGAFGHRNATYILDMGDEVSIVDLARRVIQLHGLRPEIDMPIIYTGVRDGEKLHEELTLDFESAHETLHPKIRMIDGTISNLSSAEFHERLGHLIQHMTKSDGETVGAATLSLVREIDAVPDPTVAAVLVTSDQNASSKEMDVKR